MPSIARSAVGAVHEWQSYESSLRDAVEDAAADGWAKIFDAALQTRAVLALGMQLTIAETSTAGPVDAAQDNGDGYTAVALRQLGVAEHVIHGLPSMPVAS